MLALRTAGRLSGRIPRRPRTNPSSASARVSCARTYATDLSGTANVTSVEKLVLDTIKANGPISYATYMQLCLSHPTEGYYMKSSNAVFGASGDFITSPEISQVFGELVGVWLLSQYISLAQTREIRLVELGPGRGTLMDDILRTLSQLSNTRTSLMHVHLVETSPSLRAIQAKKLQPWIDNLGLQIHWHDSIDDIPASEEVFTMLVAHEFFDALPIHVIEKTHQGWQEVLISSTPDPVAKRILRPSDIAASPPSLEHQSSPTLLLDKSTSFAPSSSPSRPRLRPVISPTPSPISTLLGSSSPRFQALPIGARIEVSAAGFQIARKVGEMIGGHSTHDAKSRRTGSALIVDYGANKTVGNSFRAFKDHKIVDPFLLPGQCDLTANVDFAYVKEAMVGTATAHGPLTQHAFLTNMGLNMRLEALVRAAPTEGRKQALQSAARRLVDLTGMGKEYQFLGITGGAHDKETDVWPFTEEEVG
ncbi:DUF185-domain-containing protein [Artomyces pyxidatus]|uniref:DUF185-domain-containing protein n=1 Tax=Artomyces pyxidatus TaxID=48021 RepID=A0ACB8TFL1_9AGAM|nr:DUF185-domain-containing protein [Artomyces pyxidatus]